MPSTPGIPARLGARIIDSLLLTAIGAGAGLITGFGYGWLVAIAIFVIGYFVLADMIFGATVGKALLGLKVVGPSGERPTVKQSLLRESFILLGAIPFAGPFLALGSWIWMFVTVRKSPLGQGWHDQFAGRTQVRSTSL